MAQVFTRQQFYDLVWARPMTHLAKEFAISDVALHKICKKHAIPNPPVGWWAKKAAGRRVRKMPLPKAALGAATSITIEGGELCREGPKLAAAREHARVVVSNASKPGTDDCASNPVVERTLARLRKTKPSEQGIVSVEGAGVIQCSVAPSSLERLGIILNRVIRTAQAQEFKLAATDGPALFERGTETVKFSVSEAVKRERHVMTAAEQEKLAAWERKRDRQSARNSWDFAIYTGRPSFPEWDYNPTGRLSLEFENIYLWGVSSPRRSFRDAKVQRLENMADNIAVGLAVYAAAKVEDRRRREAEQRLREEAHRVREAAARAKHIEERRYAALASVLGELEELERLRRLIASLVENTAADAEPRVATFLEWTRNALAEREQQLSRASLEARFTGEKLFGDTDGDGFSLSYKY